jgi:hypothetical protein
MNGVHRVLILAALRFNVGCALGEPNKVCQRFVIALSPIAPEA